MIRRITKVKKIGVSRNIIFGLDGILCGLICGHLYIICGHLYIICGHLYILLIEAIYEKAPDFQILAKTQFQMVFNTSYIFIAKKKRIKTQNLCQNFNKQKHVTSSTVGKFKKKFFFYLCHDLIMTLDQQQQYPAPHRASL